LLPAVPDIYEIDLHSNFISKIPETFFRPFISLKVLNLGANELKHIPNLRGLTCLTELYLNNNKIESLHHLDFLPQLQILDLRANRIESVTGLQNNQNLQRLSLSCNRLTNISLLPHLEKLTFLGLFGNSLHDADEVETALKTHCPNLEVLLVSNNPFVHKATNYRISLVTSLPKLNWLDWTYVTRQERFRTQK
jgi:Leucine-rich repeat (LRR) protein